MKFFKQPLLVSTGLIGLTVAMTGCTTMSQNDNKAMGQHNAQKHGMFEQRMDDHHRKMDFWHHRGDKMGEGDMNRRMANLNLTDAQKAQLQQFHAQHSAQMQQFQTSMQQVNANIAAQKKAGASSATMLSLYQQKQALMDQAMTMRKQQQQQFMQILTPDQQLKLYENQKMPMMMHGNHPMQPMQQPPRNN